jgi:hypothetical protein
MTDTNPIDDARTTRPRAGLVVKDRREAPGAALMVAFVLTLAGCLTAAAMGSTGWAIGMGAVALAAAVGGVSWILAGRNRTAGGGNHRRQR